MLSIHFGQLGADSQFILTKYLWNPGGHVADYDETVTVPDAAVFGVRSTINY